MRNSSTAVGFNTVKDKVRPFVESALEASDGLLGPEANADAHKMGVWMNV